MSRKVRPHLVLARLHPRRLPVRITSETVLRLMRTKLRLLTAILCPLIFSSHGEGADRPVALLQTARQKMDGRPWKVDGLVQGDAGCSIKGIILGQDFDLTVQERDGESRQIAIGEKSWTTSDQGKTWKQNTSIDRRYFFLVRAPIRFNPAEKIPPFEQVGKSNEDGEELVHVRFKAADRVTYEGDRPNHWLTFVDGKPVQVRRYAGPLVLNKDYVTAQVRYAAIDEAKPIQPPPGNPSAVPQVDPATAALNRAFETMRSGLWEVKAKVSAAKSVEVRGWIRGSDFDLTMEPQEGETLRQIAIGDEAWMTKDGGKSWKPISADDRLTYRWVHTPILQSRTLPPFEIVGKEKAGAEELLHVRLKVPEKLGSEKERPHYWLALGNGEEIDSVRRYEGNLSGAGGQIIWCEADYHRASREAAIVPPEANLIKAKAAALLPAPAVRKAMGFLAIDRQKAKIDGKIIPVEITGKVIQSEPIAEDQVRLMVKDTENGYGLVEISREGVKKLGLMDNGGTKPLTLYLRITNLGLKPAARATAVGARYVPSNDAEGMYQWE